VTGTLDRLDKPAGLPFSEAMKELLRTSDPTIIPFATALLEGEGIEVFALDVHMSGLGIVPQRLMVRREDHFVASAVMRAHGLPVVD
jgi:hypothetical protein